MKKRKKMIRLEIVSLEQAISMSDIYRGHIIDFPVEYLKNLSNDELYFKRFNVKIPHSYLTINEKQVKDNFGQYKVKTYFSVNNIPFEKIINNREYDTLFEVSHCSLENRNIFDVFNSDTVILYHPETGFEYKMMGNKNNKREKLILKQNSKKEKTFSIFGIEF